MVATNVSSDIGFVMNAQPNKAKAAVSGALPAKWSLRGADMAPSAPPALGPIVPSAPTQEAKPLSGSSPYALPRAADPAAPRG